MMKPHILIVEDVVDYLRSLKGILDAEYEVSTASSLEEGKRLLTANISVLLTDIRLDETQLNNIDGILLAKWAKEKFPALEVVFMTAFDQQEVLRDGNKLKDVPVLMKPLRLSILKRILKELTNGPDSLR